MRDNIFIHPSAEVHSTHIGEGSKIWQNTVVLAGAVIGENCNINFNCFLENEVVLGNNVTVKSGIYLWDGIVCEDDVFLGPNVVFTNDTRPRSKMYKAPEKTIIRQGASIGANSTILAGVTVGKYAMTGIGSVVTKDIPDYALYYGNPARFKGWLDKSGNKLTEKDGIFYSDGSDEKYVLESGKLVEMKN